MSQSDDVNVNWARSTVASPVSADETVNTTSLEGGVFNATVNESVDPPSVTEAVAFDTVTPGPIALPESKRSLSKLDDVSPWAITSSPLLSKYEASSSPRYLRIHPPQVSTLDRSSK